MKATYIDHMGNDLTVVNAARVSFAKESGWEANPFDSADTFLSEKDRKLIHYLATHNHWTPFGHPQVTLHMRAPVFVRTQCFKHKVGFTENEVSRRYVDDAPEFYVPILRKRAENKKQGSLNEFPVDLETCDFVIQQAHTYALLAYEALLERDVAPEQARMVLPQSMYTEWYWTGSLAAWARFVKQRTHDGAQKETSDLARQCAEIIAPLFPVSWEALAG